MIFRIRYIEEECGIEIKYKLEIETLADEYLLDYGLQITECISVIKLRVFLFFYLYFTFC